MLRLFLSSLLVVCCSVTAWGQGALNPRNLLPGEGIATVKFLEQNWSHQESRKFYNAPQGSQLIPYQWFLYLEQPDNQERFNDPDHLRGLGYLPRSPDSFGNRDGLPIGFVQDMPFADGTPALGFSCAACHTAQINQGPTAYLIDGAPTMGDLATFLQRLQATLETTLEEGAKFDRFAQQVLPAATPAAKIALKAKMREFLALRKGYNDRNAPAAGATPFGHGRIDAFGAILNEVSVRVLSIEENHRPADAPVSYPFLWDTPQHDFVQWNGAAENNTSELLGPIIGTTRIGALGRNTGEVLGVFGDVDVRDPTFFVRGYKSSVDRNGVIDIEDSLFSLWSPQWPPAFEMDSAQHEAGKVVFDTNCASCHTNSGTEHNFDRTSPDRFVNAKMRATGTDGTMFTNVAMRRVKTGVLEGRRRNLTSIFDTLLSEEPAVEVLSHVVQRVIIGPNFDPAVLPQEHLAALEIRAPLDVSFATAEGMLTGDFDSITRDSAPSAFRVSGRNLRFTPNPTARPNIGILALSATNNNSPQFVGASEVFASNEFRTLTEYRVAANWSTNLNAETELRVLEASMVVKYKARPLNGIWATAPFLHNGSIPNLWELLKPADQRVTNFFVGSREIDTTNVGFKSDEGPSEFDTSLKGNLNTGHEYGTALSDVKKRQLIEYLKSL